MATSTLKAHADRRRSPLTGWTREHWLEATGRLVAGVMRYVDPATGWSDLPVDPEEPALQKQLRNPGGAIEMFERTMMLAAAWLAAGGATRVPGSGLDIAETYRRGLRHAVDPHRPDYTPRYGGIGTSLAMLLAPQHFFDPLDDETKSLLAAHLAKSVGRGTRDCNTMLFSMMPAAVLERLGATYDRARLDDYFDTILSMYRGDGWFIDGWNRGFDHYNFWGFQLYLHALVAFDDRWREKYAERIREITAAHERTLPFYFGRDGAPVPKGRSLNYRFAAVSGIAYSQISGLSSMDPGLARRIASGCLRYFWDRGCLSERGLLEPGYLGPNAAVGEDYTDRGAPYWAATGLAALALPADHPFWTAKERPIEADSPGVKRCVIPGAQMVLKVDGDRGGEVRMITAGEPFFHRRVWQAGSKYYQHAYSSSLGHALAGDRGPELVAGRTGISADGRSWSYRTWPRAVRVDETRVRSEWDAWPGCEGMTGRVVTETIILDRGEVHVFWHETDAPRLLTIGGYAVRVPHGSRPTMEAREDGLAVTSNEMWSVLGTLRTVPGRLAMQEVRPRPGFKHAHLFGGWSAFPTWTSAEPVPPGVKLAVFVDAARRDAAPDISRPDIRLTEDGPRLVVEVEDRRFTI